MGMAPASPAPPELVVAARARTITHNSRAMINIEIIIAICNNYPMRLFAFVVVALLAWTQVSSAQPSSTVGVVSHLNVMSDKSQDISSLEAWKKTYITDGMSDQDKAIAIFNTLVRYRHQANPPREYLTSGEADGHVHDPLKTFHVYGYGQCCCASAEVIGLAQYLGMEARGREISHHSVPEVCYANSWHLVDGSVMNY